MLWAGLLALAMAAKVVELRDLRADATRLELSKCILKILYDLRQSLSVMTTLRRNQLFQFDKVCRNTYAYLLDEINVSASPTTFCSYVFL